MLNLITILFLTIPPFNGEHCTTQDKDFSEFRYEEQIPICSRNVSTKRKNTICKRDGIYNRKDYIVDHIIPLSLGGNNSDYNLWCQHKSINTVDIEGYAYRMLLTGEWGSEQAKEYVRNYKFNLN